MTYGHIAARLVTALHVLGAGIGDRVQGGLGKGRSGRERGDVPGWVLITMMTAGLVTVLWVFAGDQLQDIFAEAMDRVRSQ